jgi:hypothetical protein
MITIHKFPLLKGGNVSFKEADETLVIKGLIDLLHVGLDVNKHTCIWAKVDTENEVWSRVFVCTRGTGHDCSDVQAHRYLGTVHQDPFVWHVFALLVYEEEPVQPDIARMCPVCQQPVLFRAAKKQDLPANGSMDPLDYVVCKTCRAIVPRIGKE